MEARAKRKVRRFPKPQVAGSIPAGVTDEQDGPDLSVFGRAAKSRQALISTLTQAGLTRNRALHYVRQADAAAEALAEVERQAVREAIRGWL
jgi:hypothetical protein